MKVNRAFVLLSNMADTVILGVDSLPSPMPKMASEPLTLRFEAEYDTGVEYVKKHFGVEPEVVTIRRRNIR